MAKRKTATRSARPARGKARRASASGGAMAKRGRSAKKNARAGGRSVPRKASRPAKGSAAGRQRKHIDDVTAEVQRRWGIEEEDVPTPPSTLNLDRRASAASTGRAEMLERRRKHTAASPAMTGGDVDADWEGAYAVGDESATGDNPTPDQGAVEDIGRAVGVDYEDTEELKSTPKIERRDKKRWELDPASAEDYKERNRRKP